ncbi:MAG: DsbA family protein [Myxococcota bacterium]|jgi:2-hydroxychromene-2-carboxylate isomerase|nr:DsbA family protein [Myxococcota bacterium]
MALEALQSSSPLIVYFDFKSPYAYLAVEPTRALERELGVTFDWRPFVLDIPSYLGSAKLDKAGKVAQQNRTAGQWSGVKYAYYDCRRYANLDSRIVRGTKKIWDTHLVATAMLWARDHDRSIMDRFMDLVCLPFWKREFDPEAMEVVTGALSAAGADGEGFANWAQSEGFALNARLQQEAFAAGVYGVPTYVLDGEMYFGREHLPRLGWELAGKSGPAPDIGYAVGSSTSIDQPRPKSISIGVDGSLDSLLAFPALKSLLDRYDLEAEWVEVEPRRAGSLPPREDQSRGALHKHFRLRNRRADLERYTPEELKNEDLREALAAALKTHGLVLGQEGPAEVRRSALPGIVVKIDEELYIGRQHLPLIALHLASGSS